MAVTVFSPAKINLYLAITGRRSDGFHDLVSVVAPLDFGDELTATISNRGEEHLFHLECAHPEVPIDESNLILKAARAFAEATGWPRRATDAGQLGVDFKLVKRIPLGAGLGGGSSNAVATLRAMNTLSGGLLSAAQLAAIAARLGSDCALFLHGGPVIMRGRGEHIEPLSDSAAARLRGQKVLLFKPSFGIGTPWAYGRMAAEAPRHYLPAEDAERRLAGWSATSASASELLFNNMEGIAFEKFMALPVLLAKLRAEFGVEARMSGSGSACFAMTGDSGTELIDATSAGGPESRANLVTQMKQLIHHCWGEDVFVQEACLV